ncbi:hypothetical protein MLD38_024878 [Melastoma candidum]|uniref:Uncharacterized protein n=1 Tax=Melastoma candidum TaxID=119954 RepID=A0ACB9NV84_9MYRT|nr:hypothetical protein MLD38_024878 [Melastoma candidum]
MFALELFYLKININHQSNDFFLRRAEAKGRLLYLKLGYNHEVELTVPPTVRVFCFKNNVVCCTGIDK